MSRQLHHASCFWSKASQRTEDAGPCDGNCRGMLHGAMLGSGTHSCAPAATKHISHIAAGKLTYRKGKGKTTYHHIPQLKGRSKHWDMLLTRRYMLAHIPLTKINILASVLTFTSSFSSHLNHCNHCIYIARYLPSLPAVCIPSQAPLPASPPAAFYLCQASSYLHSAPGSSLDPYLTLHPSTLSFIHLFSLIF